MGTNIVITMAGRGSRFYEAGYTVPKYEIEAHGRTLFDWSMLSLKNFIDADSRVIFVCLKANDSAEFVYRRCAALGLADVHVLELDELTDGQATSAYVSRHLWREGDPLLVYNIDTYIHPRALHPAQIAPGSDGWIPCFQVPGEHWSFVGIGADGWAREVAEKKRISGNASVGLYWFREATEYVTAYDRFFAAGNGLVKGERYIAPLYAQLIGEGKKISISDLPVADVHVLGTPAELKVFLDKEATEVAGEPR
jgi:NDP-sugar pyrophosphorylase family protein